MKIKTNFLTWEGGRIPLKLYKYISVIPIKEILIHNRLKFQNPADFNDPFDCNINIKLSKDYNFIHEHLLETDLYKTGNIPEVILELKAENMMENHSEFEYKTNEVIRKHIKESGVSCFTTDPNNLLMWSHYADKHRGVCLGFDVKEDLNFFATTHPVKYINKYPTLDYIILKDEKTLTAVISTKQKIWQYENEYRIWKKPNQGFYTFNKNCLTEIIFGYNMRFDESIKSEILQILIDKGYENINVKQALLMNDKYDIFYEDIPLK